MSPDKSSMRKSPVDTTALVRRSLARRHAAEKRFRAYGVIAIMASLSFLVILLASIISKGLPAFKATYVNLDINLSAEALGVSESPGRSELRSASYNAVIRESLRELFPDVSSRREKKDLYKLVSNGAEYDLFDLVIENPEIIGTTFNLWVLADDEMGSVIKNGDNLEEPESIVTRMNENQLGWAKQLQDDGRLDVRFNTTFFENGDSREPELAGIKAALIALLSHCLLPLACRFR